MSAGTVRCAIYTRKSHDELDGAQLTSTETQRDLCAKYIASQAGEGWIELADAFDDPGYSGGTLKRPALKRLLAMIEAGTVDIVVVYKIDRLTRSLVDFARIVELFDKRGASFVSVTQSFNTASSMGRLTLNVLLSFAQFEREMTGERLRDWFAGARERGLWCSGRAPFGYDVQDKHLLINEEQAETVRWIFARYPKVGSSRKIATELNRAGVDNGQRGRWAGSFVIRILQRRLYLGELMHRGQPLPGIHDPIVDRQTFDRAARAIAKARVSRKARQDLAQPALLKHLLWDGDGRKLIHVVIPRPQKRYRYYIPSVIRYQGLSRYRAEELDDAVTQLLRGVGFDLSADADIAMVQMANLAKRAEVTEHDVRIELQNGTVLRAPHGAYIPTKSRA